MLKMIQNVPNKINDDLIRLKKSDLPLFLYGAGVGAIMTKKLLVSYNIRIEKVVVDEKYYKSGLVWQSYPVGSLKTELNKYNSVNVIISFSNYTEIIAEIKNDNRIFECFVFDLANIAFPFPNYYDFVVDNILSFENLQTFAESFKEIPLFTF